MTTRLSYALKADDTLPEGWTWSTLGDVAEVLAGNPAPQGAEYFEGGKYPFVRVQDMGRLEGATKLIQTNDKINDRAIKRLRLFPKGSLLFTKSGASTLLNQRAILSLNAYVVSHIAAAIPKNDIISEWLYYWMRTVDFAYLAHATTLPSLPLSKAKVIPIPVAPLNQQKLIVSEIEKQFSRLDQAIASLKRAKANLKRYTAAVLKAAVEGKLTEKWRKQNPDIEPASKLLERILNERRTKGMDRGKYKKGISPDNSNLSILPAGWAWALVEQIGFVQLGRQRSPKNRSSKYPTKYIRAANINERGLYLNDLLDMEFKPSELEAYRLNVGDIVLSEASGSPDQVGKPAIWEGQIKDCCFQNTVIRFKPQSLPVKYLLMVFRSYYLNKVFSKVAGGVGINHLSAYKFARLFVPIPPIKEQDFIVAEVDRYLSVAEEIEAVTDETLKRAERLRQSILAKAFSGKLIDSAGLPARAGCMTATK